MKKPVEEGNPKDAADGFRRSLGEFATGVTVITTCVDGVNYGLTSNSFASVSLNPPLVLWSIKYESQSFPAFERCTHFAVNVLSDDQMDMSQRFARSGPDKFDGIDWTPGVGGAPLLHNTTASFECSMSTTHSGGDHLILLGEVQNFRRFDRQPLLFAKGRYAVSVDHPATRVFTESVEGFGTPGLEENLLSIGMVRAYSAIAARLEKGRKSAGLGLSLMQARLLQAVRTYPDRTLDQLTHELFLDLKSCQEILNSVVVLGLLSVTENGNVHLTAEGQSRLNAIIQHARESERLLFQDISEVDLATTLRVLSQIVEQG
ncbi:flavin reductase [Phaeobacter gallaeciensis]|uniref:Flavin reductase n=1 Tax=Phaeobacter gallaeciensis TaxID=60890 RepID=A0ABD4XF52_9RHOB|nr:flavin reductase [Phaeobacter gallaeciensis]MDE4142231.1 flavin reductase [Phaeobacter gallaeciensis]MDE4146573.1 flavin reductase [Phaeobacter gallaeciensis]MDE4150646.1 flavin reductase [Phaeobacter gallaeciensis]MDE4154825.1 flavin reductase [Phaeobacter gallaeciensis]MDE4159285.1 flavin reductase [Phaeobacter gallaeciensis]